MSTTSNTIRPQPGPQTAFLKCKADFCIYGGAAGSGKSFAITIEPLRHIHNSRFGSVTFRRTSPEITREGGLWFEAAGLYPQLGAIPNSRDLNWRFPSGMRAAYSHLQYDDTVFSWYGAQIPLIQFDEITQFSKFQVFYMMMRNRSASGVPGYMRGTCNPDPDSWVCSFIDWWIDDQSGYPLYSRSGVVRWFVSVEDEIRWADSFENACMLTANPARARKLRQPKSFTFIPGTIEDNPILIETNPQYYANLLAQGHVEQERMLKGNWKIRHQSGDIFSRSWFKIEPITPIGGQMVRFWDLASTEKKLKKDDPDYTASCLMQEHIGIPHLADLSKEYWIHDAIAVQKNSADVDTLILETSRQDLHYARSMGCTYAVRWEEEGAASGPKVTAYLKRLLTGFDCDGVRPQGEKFVRARPLVQASKAGNVKLKLGPWNERWLQHMHNQPLGHDDEMDAASGSFNYLTEGNTEIPASSQEIPVSERMIAQRVTISTPKRG